MEVGNTCKNSPESQVMVPLPVADILEYRYHGQGYGHQSPLESIPRKRLKFSQRARKRSTTNDSIQNDLLRTPRMLEKI